MVVEASSVRGHSRALARATLVLGALAVLGSGASVRAAPPSERKEQEPGSEATLTPKEREIIGKYLFGRGYHFFNQEDYLKALTAWEQMLELMPDSKTGLRGRLARAHQKAYDIDRRTEHLTSAMQLFTDQLKSLEPGEQRTRIEAELAEIERKLRELEEAKAQAEEQARAKQEEELQQKQIQAEKEKAVEAQEKELAEQERKIQDERREIQEQQSEIRKTRLGVGGSLVGLGAGSLAAMTGFLVGGARLDRDGQNMAESTGVEDGAYQELLVKGAVYNRAAAATAVVGGALVAVGGSLLVLAFRHKRAPKEPRKKRAAVYPTPGGVLLRF